MSTQKANILVVDDDGALRDVYVAILQNAGFTATGATDGLNALTALLNSAPDLILSDCNMPGMNGIDLAQELRQKGSTIPIVFITGGASNGEIAQMKALGSCVLSKNCDTPTLLGAIRASIREARPLCASAT